MIIILFSLDIVGMILPLYIAAVSMTCKFMVIRMCMLLNKWLPYCTEDTLAMGCN